MNSNSRKKTLPPDNKNEVALSLPDFAKKAGLTPVQQDLFLDSQINPDNNTFICYGLSWSFLRSSSNALTS